MRTEREIFDRILSTAHGDERIRAVILNGSRANPSAPKDIFQDYDIVYIVTDMTSFKADPGWIERFGERISMQKPDDMGAEPAGDEDSYAYLMLFADGSRIDLTLYPRASLAEMERDSLSMLLDRDEIIPPFPPPDESDYFPRPPTRKQYDDCCNEFWWVCPYVAKGLWRQEIPYARYMLDTFVRLQLEKMLVWHIGLQTQFACNPGYHGKYFQRYLEPELWELLLKTYAEAGAEQSWDALLAMCRLFHLAAVEVGGHFSFEYPQGDDDRVSAYLQQVRLLPRDR
jgi:aminoglycoside 6-adenylyltransferase